MTFVVFQNFIALKHIHVLVLDKVHLDWSLKFLSFVIKCNEMGWEGVCFFRSDCDQALSGEDVCWT